MTVVGWILVVVGAAPLVLGYMGMLNVFLPAVVNVPPMVWGSIVVVGLVTAMMFRRPRD